MAHNKLTHKGYTGSYDISFDDGCITGRILFIEDIVTYEGETPADLVSSFVAAVDRYLAYCKKTGKAANKPFSGSFNVRVGPALHRKAAEEAAAHNKTLNEVVIEAIESLTSRNDLNRVERDLRQVTIAEAQEHVMQSWATSASDILETIRVKSFQ